MSTTAHQTSETVPWRRRPGLEAIGGRLAIAGRDAELLAREHGTPLYVFDLEYVREQLVALRSALERAGVRGRVRIALKALRDPEYLAVVRSLGTPGGPDAIGIDACSPGEVEHAFAHGFLPQEVSVTATNLSETDCRTILQHPVHVNADLITQVERIGRLSPGRPIGLRLNPRAGAINRRTSPTTTVYSGERPTKFGIYLEDLPAAVEAARRHGLRLDTAHFHVANGILTEDLPDYERAVAAMAVMVDRMLELGCAIREINVGGGLGDSARSHVPPLDLDAWAGILKRHLGDFDAVIACEPGEFVSIESGVLLAEVVTVERRLGHLFAGLDVGWNVINHRFVYGHDMDLVHCARADAAPADKVTFSGNINEGPDLFADDLPFPPVKEGDIVAMLGTGAYSVTNYHAHCLRPPAGRVFFADRLRVGRQ
jgi:diaminopimelate decarboxylase